jgi:hypothetical protein
MTFRKIATKTKAFAYSPKMVDKGMTQLYVFITVSIIEITRNLSEPYISLS